MSNQGNQGNQGSQTPSGSLTKSSPTLVNFYPLSSNTTKYTQVTAALMGDASYGPIAGSGGWQVVDRPKRQAATQWYDRSPFQLAMPLMMDDSFLGAGATETMCQQLESWLEVDSSNPSNYQPITFILTGPLPGLLAPNNAGAREWFMYSLEFQEAIRTAPNKRIQQKIQMTCYEYSSAIPGGNSYANASSPASAAASFLSSPAGVAYLGNLQQQPGA
jgi:hypothetical protein